MTPKDLLHSLLNDRSNQLAAVTGQVADLTVKLSDLKKLEAELKDVVQAIEIGLVKFDELIQPDVDAA